MSHLWSGLQFAGVASVSRNRLPLFLETEGTIYIDCDQEHGLSFAAVVKSPRRRIHHIPPPFWGSFA